MILFYLGYGDKTPKSPLTRLYSVAWILIGITICSLFTGTITTELAKAIKPSDHDMSGSRIGVVKYRLYDASVVAKHGGILYESKTADTTHGVRELLVKLKQGEIDGLLLDKYTYLYMYRMFKSNRSNPDEHSIQAFFLHETVQRDVHAERSDGPMMSYGFLVTRHDHYKFFKKFVNDNKLHLETCKSLGINGITMKQNEHHAHGIFTPSPRGLFWPALICTATVVGLILILGVTYDICHRRRWMTCFGCRYEDIVKDVKVETMLTNDSARKFNTV